MVAPGLTINPDFPPALACLFERSRYIVLYGGRSGAKSWGCARSLLIRALGEPIRVLCAREIQNSIKESVHKLLSEQIKNLGIESLFEVQRDVIRCIQTGAEFFFEGIKHNVNKIRSYEGIDVCWVEEAHLVSDDSWNVLTPTIRKPGSQIIIIFNPNLETDATYQRFIVSHPSNSIVKKVSWRDNPWFSEESRLEMEDLKRSDYDAYLNVWEGHPKQLLDGAVYMKELRLAMGSGRICSVPYDPTVAVHTFWDLGWADKTAIWFGQMLGFEYHIIDYYENNLQSTDHYAKLLQQKEYIYGDHWLPHDAKAKEKGSGKSYEELMRNKGFKVRIVPKLNKAAGINAARVIFPRVWFDEKLCSPGLKALKSYRYEIVTIGRPGEAPQLSSEPVHDWSSHAADAFRYLAIALKQPKQRRTSLPTVSDIDLTQDPFETYGSGGRNGRMPQMNGWMGR